MSLKNDGMVWCVKKSVAGEGGLWDSVLATIWSFSLQITEKHKTGTLDDQADLVKTIFFVIQILFLRPPSLPEAEIMSRNWTE